jgi:hypothetical protein
MTTYDVHDAPTIALATPAADVGLAPVISVGSRGDLGRITHTIELDRRASADSIGLTLAHIARGEGIWWAPATFGGYHRDGRS